MNPLEIIIFAALISADSPILTEDEKQAVMNKFAEETGGFTPGFPIKGTISWNKILQPIIDEDKREKYIKLMESAQIESQDVTGLRPSKEIKKEEEESKLADIEPVDMEVLRNEDNI